MVIAASENRTARIAEIIKKVNQMCCRGSFCGLSLSESVNREL